MKTIFTSVLAVVAAAMLTAGNAKAAGSSISAPSVMVFLTDNLSDPAHPDLHLTQETEGTPPAAEPPEGGGAPFGTFRRSSPAVVPTFDPGTADNITQILDTSASVCAAVPDVYQVDCLIAFYKKVIAETPDTGAYADVRDILQDAVDQLEDVVEQNRDTTQPAVRASIRTADRTVSSGRIRAVRPETVARVKAQALRIVAETETRLLRSADNATSGKLEFIKIAAAIGSNKVLLRS